MVCGSGTDIRVHARRVPRPHYNAGELLAGRKRIERNGSIRGQFLMWSPLLVASGSDVANLLSKSSKSILKVCARPCAGDAARSARGGMDARRSQCCQGGHPGGDALISAHGYLPNRSSSSVMAVAIKIRGSGSRGMPPGGGNRRSSGSALPGHVRIAA